MTSVSGGGNYVSDGMIMEWLATQQDRLYGDLRDSMSSAEKRAEFTDELNDIKSALHNANKGPSYDFTEVDKQMQAFLEKYGSDPEFEELCEGIKPMIEQVHKDTVDHTNNRNAVNDSQDAMNRFVERGGDPNGPAVQRLEVAWQPGDPPYGRPYDLVDKPTLVQPLSPQMYSQSDLDIWDETIKGKLDVVGKNDQITMIHVQQLKATIDQGSQFGSQFIASSDKTSSSIINNIA